MKKYSLKFEDLSLEQKYQNDYNMNIRYPILFCILSFTTIALIFACVMNSIAEKYSTLPFDIGYLAITVAAFFLTRRYKMLSQLYLFIFSQISCLITLYVSHYLNSTDIVNLFNMIVSTISVAFVIDFPYATLDVLLQIFLNYLLKALYNPPLKFEDFVYTFFSIVFFIYCRYMLEVSNRTKFLLNLKDQEWNNLLSNIVKRPFILFYFDDKNFSFELKTSGELFFPCLTSSDLKQFLRTAKVDNSTLEQLIFWEQQARIENQLPLEVQKININFENTPYSIELSGSFVQNYSYLIIFDEVQQRIRSITCTYIEQNKKILEYAEKQQRNIFKILKHCVSLPNHKPVNFLRKFLVYHLQRYLLKQIHQNKFKIQNINLITLIYDLGSLFNHKISIDCSKCRQVNISSILCLMQYLFIDFFRKLKHKVIVIYLKEENDCIILNSVAENCLYFAQTYQQISEQFKNVIYELIYFDIDEKIVGMRILILREALLRIEIDIQNGIIK